MPIKLHPRTLAPYKCERVGTVALAQQHVHQANTVCVLATE